MKKELIIKIIAVLLLSTIVAVSPKWLTIAIIIIATIYGELR
jgi:hypothetical protein